jgi:serine/threonine protein kinase
VRQVMIYAAEIVLALAHVHSHHVIFRDLKPENVMVRPMGVGRGVTGLRSTVMRRADAMRG